MTADDYRQRINRLFRATEWGYTNPYREQIQERNERAAAEHRHDVAQAKSEPATPF